MRILLISLAALILLVIGIGLFVFINTPETLNDDFGGSLGPTNGQFFEPFPVSPSTPGGGGGEPTVPAPAFLNDIVEQIQVSSTPIAYDDASSYYVLFDSSDEASIPFTILYFEFDQSFQVILNEEPLGRVRRSAEQVLLNTYNISESEACLLTYQVVTPIHVSEEYGGSDLRFSFCSDAVILREI